MTKEEIDKYVDMIMSMSLDYKMGGISMETYLSNLKLCIESMGKKSLGL